MATREDVVRVARTWLRTPFHHQARVRGHGVDCGNLVAEVGAELGLMSSLEPGELRYSRRPNPNQMRAVIAKYLDPVEGREPLPGDVVWMGWQGPGVPMHLGILTLLHGAGILHAYADAGQVVETAVPPNMWVKVHSVWTYRGLAE